MFLQVGVAHGRIEELSGRDLKIVTDGEEFCQGGQRFTGADVIDISPAVTRS